MASTGLRNNNYLNVKNGASRWMDAGNGESGTDSRGHAVFSDPAYGVRAGIMLLRVYFFKYGRRTIAEILERWAPADDTIGSLPGAPPNSPREYSTFVAGRMRISYNQKLEIFKEDQSIGNVAQLRDLLFAMAAYEIGGGFEVPVKDFNAGLELIQPGIKKDGTKANLTNAVLTVARLVKRPRKAKWKISGSVGRWDRGAANSKKDIQIVQRMLRNAAMITRDATIDPGAIDGRIARDPKKSATVKAIESFQSRFFVRPDGLIEVEERTWNELLRVLTTSPQIQKKTPRAQPARASKLCFPFAQLPSSNWTTPPRSFAANRDNGNRAHAGCDLYFPEGTVIHAVGEGTVVRGPYLFYAQTYAIEIDHGAFIARYGEIQETAFVREADHVEAGQPIARVGHLVGLSVPSDMLHFELYDKSGHGSLTVPVSGSLTTPDGRPFMRRKDLIDPTPELNQWKNNLPGTVPTAPRARAHAKRASMVVRLAAIPPTGFCIHLKRLRQESRSSMGFARTIGNYQCYWNGSAIGALTGQIVERGGPGDNTTEVGDNRNLRIQKGRYPLSIQDGTRYKTLEFDETDKTKTGTPKPGLLLGNTDERTAILIHPGSNYVNSIGCLNPASGLTDADSQIVFSDSRSQVIGIIDGMKAKMGSRFPRAGIIPDAVIVIEGEPT